ncbi:hypothetical protein BN1708_007271 [Verticillium longisporum]|uniref:Uncharacterized protein n=1 Tax=Verticillium longisporum TaxID=100787 RepID=A0A0G4MS10_VERLO|nr:hypothetical protein BN1708_007271 [Verticillium longisporum]
MAPTNLLVGKTAIISGGTTGIGRAIALEYLRQGANVVVNHLGLEKDQPHLDSLIAEAASAPGRLAHLTGDIREPATAAATVELAVQHAGNGRLDICVSNAGICTFAEFLDLTPDLFTRTVRTNLDGAFYFVQAAARQMAAQSPPGGSIIGVSSISALVGGGLQTHYTPTKAGVLSLMQSTAVSAMAAAYDIPVVPHASGPYSYHFVLSQPNTPFQEYLANSPDGKSVLPVFGDLFLDEPIPNKGFLTAADLDKPGFGLTLNPAARSKLISADRWLNPAPVAALTPAAPEVEAPKAVEAPKEESAPAAAVAAPVEEAKTNGVNGTTTNGVNGVVHDITAKVQELTTGSAEPVATN